MAHLLPFGINLNQRRHSLKITEIDFELAASTRSSLWDGFEFTLQNSHRVFVKEDRIEDGVLVNRTSCTERLAEKEPAVKVRRAIADRPTSRDSWVEISNPPLSGSWMEIACPDLQQTWMDGPPPNAPSCSDDNTPSRDPNGVKGKAEFVWGWLKAVGNAILG